MRCKIIGDHFILSPPPSGNAATTAIVPRPGAQVNIFEPRITSPACEIAWCGAREGRCRINGESLGSMSFTEQFRVTSNCGA